MNFLAHFHLAWPNPSLIAGALEGDYYKGTLPGSLPRALEPGVVLHRAIDAYTDAHPIVLQLRCELPQQLRRYVGILIDLSFDHYLSRHWSQFCALSLKEFNASVYRTLAANKTSLSTEANRMAARLIEYDVLSLYVEWQTVLETAARLGMRFKRHNPFLQLDLQLTPQKVLLEAAFLEFYPQLQTFCQNRLSATQQ